MRNDNPIIKLLDYDMSILKDMLSENIENLSEIYDNCQDFDTDDKSEDEEQNEYIKLYIGVSGYDVKPLILNKSYFMDYIKKNHGLYYELLKQVRDVESASINNQI